MLKFLKRIRQKVYIYSGNIVVKTYIGADLFEECTIQGMSSNEIIEYKKEIKDKARKFRDNYIKVM